MQSSERIDSTTILNMFAEQLESLLASDLNRGRLLAARALSRVGFEM